MKKSKKSKKPETPGPWKKSSGFTETITEYEEGKLRVRVWCELKAVIGHLHQNEMIHELVGLHVRRKDWSGIRELAQKIAYSDGQITAVEVVESVHDRLGIVFYKEWP